MASYSIFKVLPNLLTISSFIFGFSAIFVAIDGKTTEAVAFLIIASILDLFDGKLARLLGVDSKFGAELDSLSDFLCFGVATALIVLFFQDAYSNILYVGVCFFAVGAMLRLARFNLQIEYPDKYKNYFVGIPTPSAFLLAIFPISISFTFDIHINTIFYSIYLIVIGFGMSSMLPTPSVKNIKIKRIFLPIVLAIIALIIICIIKFLWQTIFVFNIIYLFVITVIAFNFYTKK